MEEKKYTDLDILLLEDVDFDAELIRRHLAKNNLIGNFRHVTNLKDFQSEIENRIPRLYCPITSYKGIQASMQSTIETARV
jgi:hypothetical protein